MWKEGYVLAESVLKLFLHLFFQPLAQLLLLLGTEELVILVLLPGVDH